MERYIAQRERALFTLLETLDWEEWFDLWHCHIDLECKAGRVREWIDQATYRLLRRAEALSATRQGRVQVFAILSENTGDSALYVHTENPQQTPFPVEFQDVDWEVEPPPHLAGMIESHHQVGRARPPRSDYFIRARLAAPTNTLNG